LQNNYLGNIFTFMRIAIKELRNIIKEEIEQAYASKELEEGLGKWLAGAALAGGLALGAMKGGGSAHTAEKSQDSMHAYDASQKKNIEAKVDAMDTTKMKDVIGTLKNSNAAKNDARFKGGLERLEKTGKEEMKLGLKTFATDTSFAHHKMVANTISTF